MTAAAPRRCLVVTRDLMAYSRLASTVRAAGLFPFHVARPDVLAGALQEGAAAVVVDLAEATSGVDAVRRAAADARRPVVFAIGPHVDHALMEKARAAGATDVLPNSASGEPLRARLAPFA